MEESSDNLMDLYKDIYTIEDYFWEEEDKTGATSLKYKDQIHNYCHYENDSGNGNCHNDYLKMASSGVIHLLEALKKYNLEYDKLAEYAILWLSYKLNQKPNNNFTKLNDFYDNYIEKNNYYNKKINSDDNTTYKDIIYKKKDLMNMNINEISKFNRPFNILFQMYHKYHVENWNYEPNLTYAKAFAEEFEQLYNDFKNIEGSPYTQILSTLSNDYDNLKNKYSKDISCNFPSLSIIEPKKISVENSAEHSGLSSVETLGQTSYSIKDLYSEFNKIDGEFGVTMQNGRTVEFSNESINRYCPYNSTYKNGYCINYLQSASSGVIHLLEALKKYNLEYDKLAEYVILLLSYKLNQHPEYSRTKLNNFYTQYIEKNDDYNKKINSDDSLTYKDIIYKKKDLMDNNEISKFNYPFSILCTLYNGIKTNNRYCTKYSSSANIFVDEFEQLNNDSSIIGNASYRKLLSTLSDDYNNLINNYDNIKSCDFPTLSPVKTSLTSSIASKLIPGLSTFAIPTFLGIAYKYSLFGIDKLFQRQYIRKKLKKITKKMKLNI
ncbi:hypothetical protein YYE_04753 [Plasmodium vinckei vinckei]|uniref:PIR protein CIR protein n=1 Tax=Plasmodium vinckei vinckei TaxID=54757 RepID=A0A081IA61_PLAVN|nr:hypothetical protein YYE_04753 [Plasmodium vinckei vinckei]